MSKKYFLQKIVEKTSLFYLPKTKNNIKLVGDKKTRKMRVNFQSGAL
jgi:hypothetical protein